MTREILRETILNYINETRRFPDGELLMGCLDDDDDILILSKEFEAKYGFRCPDIMLAIIWNWHSTDWDASWLIVTPGGGIHPGDGNKNMDHFDNFFKMFKPK